MPRGSATAHHLVPRTFGGRETVDLHRICHRKIHALFTERELQRHYNSIDRLLDHPEIRSFVDWVRPKDPFFYTRTVDAKRKGRGRR